jgi:hypothetical protein
MSRDKPNHLDFRDEWRRQVLADSRLAPSQKLAAAVIADRADFSGKPFRLGHEYITSSLGTSGNTVGRAIKTLTDIKALKNYTPGKFAGGYRYTSIFEMNFAFLSDNSFINGDADKQTWQVEFIKCGVVAEDGSISLSAHPGGLSGEGFANPPNGTSAKSPNGTSANPPPEGTTPSISSELQRTGYKEGETTTLSADAPDGALPTLSLQEYEIGYVELTDAFTGQIKKPKDAFGEYVKQIKSGRVTHGHLVGKAQAQADAISELDARSRPDLARWLKEWMYDRRMDDDDNVVAVI